MLRFASVYRQFKDINSFMAELNKLLEGKIKVLKVRDKQSRTFSTGYSGGPALHLMDCSSLAIRRALDCKIFSVRPPVLKERTS
jgi:hypothetical protein